MMDDRRARVRNKRDTPSTPSGLQRACKTLVTALGAEGAWAAPGCMNPAGAGANLGGIWKAQFLPLWSSHADGPQSGGPEANENP